MTEDLKARSWTTGMATVQALKDVALAQGKCAVVSTRGETYRLLQWNSANRAANGIFGWHDTGTNLAQVIGM